MPRSGKKTLRFYNNSGKLDNVVDFLEMVQKKVNYIDLTVNVDCVRDVEIVLSGPKDLQLLAIERLQDLANKYLS